MKKINYLIFIGIILLVVSLESYSQPGTISLSFSGDNNGQPITLESVWIKNISQNCDTTLYPPDFTLVIDTILTGISNPSNSGNDFTVSQNFPNPFTDQTTISIYLPEKDHIEINVSNLFGQQLANYGGQLNSGNHNFKFFPGNENIYLLSVNDRKSTKAIRIIHSGNGSAQFCSLEYTGNGSSDLTKSILLKNYFDFNPGDQLLFVGHTASEESGILDSPNGNEDYVFQFATNVPCPELDSLFYDGRYYHTIQIFSQCWMKENLEAGTMIPSSQSQINNGAIEKYCYGNNANNCTIKGGLYLWEEVMQYTTNEGIQGICPAGWHIPSDEEWKILEGIADSQYGIGDPIWDNSSLRGIDAGKNLKSTSGWTANGNGLDIYGFAAVSGGYWWQNSFFSNAEFGIYWTSTLSSQLLPWYRGLRWDIDEIGRMTYEGVCGYSVRCLKD